MEEPEAITALPQVAFKKRNVHAKSSLRKRPATPPPASDSDSSFESSEDEEGRRIKRRRKNAGVIASSSATQFPRPLDLPSTDSSIIKPIATPSDEATRASNWYDEEGAHNYTSSKPAPSAEAKRDDIVTPDGTYKGVANYQSFIQKNPDRAPRQVGPVKTSTNVRTITTTDFAPDVCKDYKQTGFCGFGDSCKFLHAREDYKQGWALDRDWEVQTKGKKLTGKTVASANRNTRQREEDEDEDALLEKIPFACIVCKDSYKNPIVTKCGHYFCEKCALQRYRKDPSCAACGTDTGGVFNVAKKLNKLLERKRERASKLEEQKDEQ